MRVKIDAPTLKCKDCGELVDLDEDYSMCQVCGSMWVRQWQVNRDDSSKIELWTFVSVDKANRRRRNGNE